MFRKILAGLVAATILSTSAFAQNATSGSPRVQGVPAGYGDPVQVTIRNTDGSAPAATAVSQSGTWNITNVSGTVSLPTGAATSAAQATSATTLSTIATNTAAATPAGTNVIGRVGIDQTTPGTTNLVAAGQNGTWNVTNVSGTVSLPTGAATSANQTTELTDLGIVTETAPATDTASSGINGRLQRIAQNITTNTTTPLVAGSAIIGNVRIDQTTPGTTNGTVPAGNVAAGATDSGNPVKVAGRYNSTNPTLTDGQRGDLTLDSNSNLRVRMVGTSATGADGVANTVAGLIAPNNATTTPYPQMSLSYGFNGSTYDRARGDTNGAVTQPYAMLSSRWSYAAATGGITNTTTAVTVKTAAGASVRNCITSFQIDFGALGTATEFAFRDGAAGTVLWRMNIPAGMAGMREITFPAAVCGTANTLLEAITLTASTTGSVFVNIQGYTGS